VAQTGDGARHSRIYMSRVKRLIILLILAAGLLGWYNNAGPGSAMLDRAWQAVETPFRIARLLAAPADTKLRMPVAGAKASRVADTWHTRRERTRLHEGQDIFARRGTPVLSATRGIVVRIGDNTPGGHTVSVLGSGGRTYYYAHLDGYSTGIEVGQEVQPGDLLGYVGNTGNARMTPPHLHFGVYGPGGPIDPLPLFTG
jgi:peptidoglycan LD-endopeptidase LytH